MPPRELLEPPAISPLERQLLVNTGGQQTKPAIQAVPKSSVLSKVRSFLPQMQQANAQLEQRLQSCDAAEVDIEHISQGVEAQVIQMDLACGLLDLHDEAALAAAQRAIATGAGVVEVEPLDAGTSDSSSSSSSDEDDDDDHVARQEQEQGAPASSSQQQQQGEGQGQKKKKTAGASPQQAAAAAAGGAKQQQQEQQQQADGGPKKRKKVKAKRPMIVEM